MPDEMKWAPTPWKYRPDKYDDWGVVRAADGTLVAHARSAAWHDDALLDAHRKAKTDPAETHARLICAAPDLYEALQKLLAACEDARISEGLRAIWTASDAARAALDRASGGVE